jgi:hypothetical protein
MTDVEFVSRFEVEDLPQQALVDRSRPAGRLLDPVIVPVTDRKVPLVVGSSLAKCLNLEWMASATATSLQETFMPMP